MSQADKFNVALIKTAQRNIPWLHAAPFNLFPSVLRNTSWPYFLDSDPRIVWSLFMVLSSLFYGLIPRISLLWAGARKIKATMRNEKFNQTHLVPLWNRMSTATGGFVHPPQDSLQESLTPAIASAMPEAVNPPVITHLAFVPKSLNVTSAQTILTESFRGAEFDSSEIVTLPARPGERFALINKIIADKANHIWRVALLREASMPPTEELAGLVRDLRKSFGSSTTIHILLFGAKGEGLIHRLPTPKLDAEIWRNWCKSLGDLKVVLVPNTSEKD